MVPSSQPSTLKDIKSIVKLANIAFGHDSGAVIRWLRAPNLEYGGRPPVDVIKTKNGAEAVEGRLLSYLMARANPY